MIYECYCGPNERTRLIANKVETAGFALRSIGIERFFVEAASEQALLDGLRARYNTTFGLTPAPAESITPLHGGH